MDKIIDHVKTNLKSFLTFDKELLYEILEMGQMSVIVVVVMALLMKFTTKLYLKLFYKNRTVAEYETFIRNADKKTVLLHLALELFANTLVFHFIKRLVKVIPPVTYLFDRNTVPYETFENVINIIMLVMFIELSPTVKMKMDVLLDHISAQ